MPAMHLINADLHSHSNVSDGTLTPEALAARAHSKGVQLWALTDHDELAGQQRARDAALALGMDYLTGTEISVSFVGQTVHIVGLGLTPKTLIWSPAWPPHAAAGAKGPCRWPKSWLKVGIPGVFEGALRYVGNPDLISRTHFARYMVEAGVCDDTHAVFRSYLTQGNPGYVPHEWARLGDAVRWIVEAGGVAVIAHPARYKFTANEEFALFTEFIAHGGRGVEVVTGSHSHS
jgi:predicted metal-dependent phosphoesterase TrpH